MWFEKSTFAMRASVAVRRAALHVGLLLRYQVDAVLRGSRHPVHLHRRDLELLLDARDHALADVDGVAGGLAVVVVERERQRVGAVRDRHGIAGADTLERLGVGGGGGDEAAGEQQESFHGVESGAGGGLEA